MTKPVLHAERLAIEAGTHEPAVDDFGTQYLARTKESPEPWREMYLQVAEQYAILLERLDLAEDATAADILQALRATPVADTAGIDAERLARALNGQIEARDIQIGRDLTPVAERVAAAYRSIR